MKLTHVYRKSWGEDYFVDPNEISETTCGDLYCALCGHRVLWQNQGGRSSFEHEPGDYTCEEKPGSMKETKVTDYNGFAMPQPGENFVLRQPEPPRKSHVENPVVTDRMVNGYAGNPGSYNAYSPRRSSPEAPILAGTPAKPVPSPVYAQPTTLNTSETEQEILNALMGVQPEPATPRPSLNGVRPIVAQTQAFDASNPTQLVEPEQLLEEPARPFATPQPIRPTPQPVRLAPQPVRPTPQPQPIRPTPQPVNTAPQPVRMAPQPVRPTPYPPVASENNHSSARPSSNPENQIWPANAHTSSTVDMSALSGTAQVLTDDAVMGNEFATPDSIDQPEHEDENFGNVETVAMLEVPKAVIEQTDKKKKSKGLLIVAIIAGVLLIAAAVATFLYIQKSDAVKSAKNTTATTKEPVANDDAATDMDAKLEGANTDTDAANPAKTETANDDAPIAKGGKAKAPVKADDDAGQANDEQQRAAIAPTESDDAQATAPAEEEPCTKATVTVANTPIRFHPYGTTKKLDIIKNANTEICYTAIESGWLKIKHKGKEGYVCDCNTNLPIKLPSKIRIESKKLNVRSDIARKDASLGNISMGEILTPTKLDGCWYQITFEDQTGYINKCFTSVVEE